MSTDNRENKASQEELRDKIHSKSEETKIKLKELSQKMNGIIGKLNEMPEGFGLPLAQRTRDNRDSRTDPVRSMHPSGRGQQPELHPSGRGGIHDLHPSDRILEDNWNRRDSSEEASAAGRLRSPETER